MTCRYIVSRMPRWLRLGGRQRHGQQTTCRDNTALVWHWSGTMLLTALAWHWCGCDQEHCCCLHWSGDTGPDVVVIMNTVAGCSGLVWQRSGTLLLVALVWQQCYCCGGDQGHCSWLHWYGNTVLVRWQSGTLADSTCMVTLYWCGKDQGYCGWLHWYGDTVLTK